MNRRTNVRLGRKCLQATNTLAYFSAATVAKKLGYESGLLMTIAEKNKRERLFLAIVFMQV
jgi:hypothetical protein